MGLSVKPVMKVVFLAKFQLIIAISVKKGTIRRELIVLSVSFLVRNAMVGVYVLPVVVMGRKLIRGLDLLLVLA